MKKNLFGGAVVLAICIALIVASATRSDQAVAAEGTRIFELRTYHATPGKMADLNKRFKEHTNALFKKHGMEIIGFWTPVDGDGAENTLIYILAHKSRDEAKKSWAAFAADPDWVKARKESEANGSLTTGIESRFMNPTDYSPLR